MVQCQNLIKNSDPVNLAANNPKKMIDMLKNGNFLDLEPIPNAGPLIYKKDLCNRFFIGNMQILRLKHDNQNKINQYYVFPKPISGGATSRVFHASPLDAVDIDGKPIKQCVTIKSVMLDLLPPEVMDDIRKEQQFLEVFRKKTHNKHIIHLFDEFEDTTKNRLIFVMERGEQDLMKHLQKLSQEWSRASPGMLSIKQTITDILNQVVDAVAEMHKTIIHLDLKSDNLIFVKENIDGVEKEVLKVIDFGGSEFIKPDKESALDERQVSNVCKLRKTMWSDDRYSSPEQIKLCQVVEENEPVYPVSSKSDIWAIGMMLIEFLLMTPVFNIDPVVVKRSKDYKNIYNAVINLNRYHYSKKKVQKPVKPYKIYLKTIEVQFPKFYQIIEACLSSNPQHRPTAKGIKDFLDGKCKFSMWTHVNGKNKCDMGVWVKPPKKV
uniref:Protein kinase domain-containing protein n=1 Tax=Globodera pallida TaxID=36090 RepID=A0A183BXR0_GLOPA